MNTEPVIYPPWLRWVIWAIVGAALIVAALLVFGGVRLIFRPAPFAYSAGIYAPQRTSYCPGETVTYELALSVRSAPALLIVARTLWDTNAGRTIVPETMPSYFVWTEAERAKAINKTVKYRLPELLPAGLYEIHGAATSFNSDSAAYRVPVVVRECKGGK